MNDSVLQVMLTRYNSVKAVKIKKEVKESTGSSFTAACNFGTDNNLCGKALDFQYSVKPKQEILDIKCESETDHLVGEIVEFSEEENNFLCNDGDGETEQQKDPQSQYVFCQKCDEIFPYKNHALHANVRTLVTEIISKNNPFFCDICDITVDNAKEAFDHLDVHNGTPFICDQCPYTTKKLGEVVRHRELQHQNSEVNLNKTVSCRESDSAKCNLTGEVDLNKQYSCYLCNFRSSFIYSFKRHMEIHVKRPDFADVTTKTKQPIVVYRENKNFFCELCDFGTQYRYSLKKHRETHKNGDLADVAKRRSAVHLQDEFEVDNQVHPNVYCCNRCNYKTTFELDFQMHTIFMHSSDDNIRGLVIVDKRHNCTICGFTGADKSKLTVHMRRKHGTKNFQCDLCLYATQVPDQLKRHIAYKHTKDKKYKKCFYICEICAKCYQTQRALNCHLVKVHNKNLDLPTYYCHNCNYKDVDKRAFTQHVLKHVRREQLFCANCDYKTPNKTNLIQHMVKHADPSKLKMYKCMMCSFETKRPHTLRHHIKSHSKKI